jgi:hypothetical protein
MIEWPASASRAWNQSIRNLGFVLPRVAQTCAIHYPITAAALPSPPNGNVANEAPLWAEWAQFKLENLYFEGSNQYNPYDVYLEGANHHSDIKHLISNPVQGSAITYSTVLLKTDTCDLNFIGEDGCGINFGTVEGLYAGRGYGGYTKAFDGRLLSTSFHDAFANPPYSGSAYLFTNTVSSNIWNVFNEGSGATTGQILCVACNGNTFGNLGIGGPGGFTGAVAGFYIIDAGSGWSVAPTSITIPDCSGFTISAQIGGGKITGFTITGGGTCTNPGNGSYGGSRAVTYVGGTYTAAGTAKAYIGGGDGIDLVSSNDNSFDYRFNNYNNYYVSFNEAGKRLINVDTNSHRNLFHRIHMANTAAKEITFTATDNYLDGWDWKSGLAATYGNNPFAVQANALAFASLGTVPAAGVQVYCTNCTTAATCVSGGSGHLAVSNGTAWTCQ